MINNKFGDLICKLRKEKHLTQKDLAAILNVSDKAISRWETGKGFPTLETTYQISQFFNVSFNDLMAMQVSTNNEDDILKNIIKQFNETDKKRKRLLIIVTTIFVIVAIILVSVMIFTNTYNRFKVYRVFIENENFKFTEGIYIETRKRDELYLGNIKIDNYVFKSTDIIKVDIYYKEKNKENILQSFEGLDRINYSSTQSYINIKDLSEIADNLYIKITIINDKNETTKYESKLEFVKSFSNNKFYGDEELINKDFKLYDLSTEEIKDKLLNNEFKEFSDSVIGYIGKDYKLFYLIDTNKIELSYEKNNFLYKYIFSISNGILYVIIYDEDNIEIENYKYDTMNNKIIECNIGKCNSYKEALNLLDKYALKYLKK